jgi:hypothetical protein
MDFLIKNSTQAQLWMIQGSWEAAKMVASCCFSMHSGNHRLLEINFSLMTAKIPQEHVTISCTVNTAKWIPSKL